MLRLQLYFENQQFLFSPEPNYMEKSLSNDLVISFFFSLVLLLNKKAPKAF